MLQPLAAWYDADLYLPTGEITDTLLYEMAKDGAADGRPMQVFPLSDCAPAGWQMPISIARKLQALRDLHFPRLEFAVWPVGLTHDQVRRLRLPSTPLKETERRADRWRQAFGVEQTEIDALAPLQPAVLSEIVQAAIRPFYDAGLAARISQAEAEWSKAAQAALAEHSDGGQLAAVRAQAAAKLAELEEEIDALNQALEQTVPDDIPLPPIVIPDADVRSELHGKPLVSSDDDWWTATRALIDRKRYADDEGRAGA